MTPLPIPPVPDHCFPGLAGQTSVVGGAGGGVGTAVVAMLVRSGARVLVADKAADRLAQLEDRFAEVTGVRADITTDEGIGDLERAIAATTVHSLVNVVGGVTPDDIGHFLDLTPDQWRHSLGLNLEYAVRTCQIAARRMAVGRGGALVNLSVAGARRAMPWFSPYGAARSALEAVTRTMAVELGPFGIRANSVAWGLVDSPRAHSGAGSDGRLERDLIPLGRRGAVAEVAATVMFLLSDLSSYTTGQNLAVDGGLSLRGATDGPHDNIPAFLEHEPTRRKLRDTFERTTGRP
ncbi:SDR family NAD(P)-dependent oxidoreductase [Amycolatopsis thermoflava]|uniref:SDR family NAD(P)-dependent oxidoreductase n=1 Tax=Amycolatopsis thermoflava TaxID=84480 RepID=UPI00040BC51F|nr:SDR family oxidoreductase [Amycolatopsis thermoflava]